MKIKVSEVFYSIQGEGVYMGAPSVFVRTFGCNFECRGFGLPRGQTTEEPEEIAKKLTANIGYNDLPLAKYGCDSYAAWHPAFKNLSPFYETDELVDKIHNVLPEEVLFRNGDAWDSRIHLILTGGEPLLGWQKAYIDLFNHDRMENLYHVTFETNGTQKLRPEFKTYLSERCYHGTMNTLFSVSAKLSASGEKWEDAIKPEIVEEYLEAGDVAFKFVVDKLQDINEINRAVDAYFARPNFQYMDTPVYLMPVGGTMEAYEEHKAAVANLAMKYGYRYSDRLQVPLFKNAWGT